MTLDIIVGTQWGDEGKGRVVDLLAAESDYAARFNGGDNAGHTVTVGKDTFKLHLIPSGIIHPHVIGIIGNGLVINPKTLLGEIEMLHEAGIDINPVRLKISHAAHIITPGHQALDLAREKARSSEKIGTTLRGIGPAYNDKANRSGIRAESMLSIENFADQIETHIKGLNKQLTSVYGADPLDPTDVAQEYLGYAHKLKSYISDISLLLSNELKAGKSILAEGAQGTLLDIDHGTYPYVTSSNPTAAGALIGLGLGIIPVNRVNGVTKAFQTRVGEGPFVTEIFGEDATRLRGTGKNPWDEFGTTTGRPRRVGWLDIVLLRYAARINGLSELTVTKLDILSGIDPLRICTNYRVADQTIPDLPMGSSDLSPYEPVYEELPGWEDDISEAKNLLDLPNEARFYLKRIQELTEIPIKLVSVGPERDQIVLIK